MSKRWNGPWSASDSTYWELNALPIHATLYKKRKGVTNLHWLKPFKELYYLDSNLGCMMIDAKTDSGAKQIALTFLKEQIAKAVHNINS